MGRESGAAARVQQRPVCVGETKEQDGGPHQSGYVVQEPTFPPTSNLHTLTGWPRALGIDGYPTEWTLCSPEPARLSDRHQVSMTIVVRRSLIPLRAKELEEIVLGIFLRSWPARGPISTVPLTTVDS